LIIRDDAHYIKGLKWLTDEAERLEELEINDKLALPEWKAELLINYNKAERNLAMYRNAQNVLANPELKTEYKEIGWEYEAVVIEVVPEPAEPPAPEPEPAAKNWLDD
jgi:hypothetical protein